MRYLFMGLIAVFLLGACGGNDKPAANATAATSKTAVDTANFTTIEWIDSTSKDFGKIPEGTQLEVAFRFKNTGDKPLVIERVQPSCGCTVAQETPPPVPPGGEGTVKASFNSNGRSGINHKTLTVFSNTKGSQTSSLHFQVEVGGKAAETNK